MIILGFLGSSELLIIAALLLLPLIALVDILRHNFNGSDKLIWVLVVLLLPILGSILYFLIGSSKKIKN
jgi:hypothetical protein